MQIYFLLLFMNTLQVLFKKCPNPKGKLFLQDGDPSQNSCKARSAWDKIGPRKFSFQHIVLM